MWGTLAMVVRKMKVPVFEIREILAGCVVVAAFDFAVALADSGVDGLVCLTVEVAGEAVRCLTSGTGEACRPAGIFLKIGLFGHGLGY